MMQAVSRPLRRTLALAILLSVLVAGWSFVVDPLIEMSRDRRADIVALSDQLAHLQTIIGRQPELVRRAASEQTALQAEGGLWTGASTAEIAAGMQDRLRKVVADDGGQIRSTAIVAESHDHGFQRVTVHFSIEATLETVQATLAATEAARPAMVVDSVALHAIGVEGSGGGPAGRPDRPQALTMELDVSGYTRMAGP